MSRHIACLILFSAYFTLRIKSLENKVINGSNVLVCRFNVNFNRSNLTIDFQIVVNITWTDASGRIYSDEQIVTQKPLNEISYFTPDDERNYTCTGQMFVNEVLFTKTEKTIPFIRRKIHVYIS